MKRFRENAKLVGFGLLMYAWLLASVLLAEAITKTFSDSGFVCAVIWIVLVIGLPLGVGKAIGAASRTVSSPLTVRPDPEEPES